MHAVARVHTREEDSRINIGCPLLRGSTRRSNRKEHRAIVDKRVDAPRGVGVINCLLIPLSLHEMVTIAGEKERRKEANE